MAVRDVRPKKATLDPKGSGQPKGGSRGRAQEEVVLRAAGREIMIGEENVRLCIGK